MLNRKLDFGSREYDPDIRFLSDMMDVLFDKEWLQTVEKPESIPLYYMYRDLSLNEEDRRLIKENNLRYDITIIPPSNLGREYVKTAGHFHPNVGGTGLSFTEIYQVLEGVAHYLLQKNEGNTVVDAVLFEASQGDKVIIPPGYGHITINPSDKELRMANWVSSLFSSEYGEIKKKHGGAFFELAGEGFVANNEYLRLPELRRLKVEEHIDLGEDMYYIIRESPESLGFLNKPQDYEELFEDLLI